MPNVSTRRIYLVDKQNIVDSDTNLTCGDGMRADAMSKKSADFSMGRRMAFQAAGALR